VASWKAGSFVVVYLMTLSLAGLYSVGKRDDEKMMNEKGSEGSGRSIFWVLSQNFLRRKE
jgi:hypothetical protein